MMQNMPLLYSDSSIVACLTLGKIKILHVYRSDLQLPFRAHLLLSSLLCVSLPSSLCHKHSRHIPTSRPLHFFLCSKCSPNNYMAFILTSFRPLLKVTLPPAVHSLFYLLRDGRMWWIKLRNISEKWKQI